MSLTSTVTAHLVTDRRDPTTEGLWNQLLLTGTTNEVFLTWEWQRAWWETFHRGTHLIISAERNGRVQAIAPMFAEDGMAFFCGVGGSDYLDFIGTIDVETAAAVLTCARELIPNFVGFRFHHVPSDSATGTSFREIADRVGLSCHLEQTYPCPALDLTDESAAEAALNKKSLVRHERAFQREGGLEVMHLRDPDEVLAWLPEFFEQHVARWASTSSPSLFLDPLQRDFYARVVARLGAAGWLRFSVLWWRERAIAFHFGFCYGGRFLWYKPTFAPDLAKRSPGEALLRGLLRAALAEGAHTFDFGLGDEAFKSRFSTHVRTVTTWGLYPPGDKGAG
jgi:CelD/BcsL family acetyltransferase involved in cellulose biosynthesis